MSEVVDDTKDLSVSSGKPTPPSFSLGILLIIGLLLLTSKKKR